MSAPPIPLAPPEAKPQALPTPVIQRPLACVRCGYGLRGLRIDGVCPECSGPIVRSLHGDLLRFADPGYVRTLRLGALTAEVGVIVMLAMILGGVAVVLTGLAAGWDRAVVAWVATVGVLVAMACAVLTLVGWFMLSAPDPARLGVDTGVTARKLLRGALAGGAVAWAGLVLLSIPQVTASMRPGLYLPLSTSLAVGVGASVLAQLLSASWYTKALGTRLDRPAVAKNAVRLRWSMLALVAAGAVFASLLSNGLTRSAEALVIGAFLTTYSLFAVVAAKYANTLDLIRKELGKL